MLAQESKNGDGPTGTSMAARLELPPDTLNEFRRGKRSAIIKAIDELAPELILMKKGRLTLFLEGNKVKSSEVYYYNSHCDK